MAGASGEGEEAPESYFEGAEFRELCDDESKAVVFQEKNVAIIENIKFEGYAGGLSDLGNPHTFFPHSSTDAMAGASGEGEKAPESYWEQVSDVAYRKLLRRRDRDFLGGTASGGDNPLSALRQEAELEQEEALAVWNEGNIDDGCIKYEEYEGAQVASIPLDHPVLLYINGERSDWGRLSRKDCLEGTDTVMAPGGETFVAMSKLRGRLLARDAGRGVKSVQKR